MAVGDLEDDSSSSICPLSYHSSSKSNFQMSLSPAKENYSLNRCQPSFHHQQQPKPSASSPLSPRLSATIPFAATHSSSVATLPVTGGHLEVTVEDTGGHPALESEATGGHAKVEADGAVGAVASFETTELLSCKPALEVIEMGFTCEVVETVILLKVVETGENYLTTEALLEAVIAYQVAMNDDDDDDDDVDSQRNEDSNSNSRNSPSHQNRQLEMDWQQNLSASFVTQRGDRATGKKKKGRRNGKTSATGNQHQTNSKSSNLLTDGENMEGNSYASAPSQKVLSPFLLKEENKKMKSSRLCKICVENEIRIVFLPCGHLVSCAECSSLIQNCTICHRAVNGAVKVFLA